MNFFNFDRTIIMFYITKLYRGLHRLEKKNHKSYPKCILLEHNTILLVDFKNFIT